VEKNEDVTPPLAMINDDYRPTERSSMENVEGRRLQEGVKARQGLYLLNKFLAIVQKLLLPHYKTTVWIHLPEATEVTFNMVVW